MLPSFAGMNPYLEAPDLWPGVHSRLISAIERFLSGVLPPQYFVAVEQRVYEIAVPASLLVGIPDVTLLGDPRGQTPGDRSGRSGSGEPRAIATLERPQAATIILPDFETVRETYLEVRSTRQKEVVLALEVLSPTNKVSPEGRSKYLQKRQTLLGSPAHFVEVDLLRAGGSMPIAGVSFLGDYRILVSPWGDRPLAQLYAFGLGDPIPAVSVPLLPGDGEVELALQPLLEEIYTQGRYALQIDYSRPYV